MNFDDFNNLDMEDVGSWPQAAKIVATVFLFIVLLAAGWWFDTKNQIEELELVQTKEQELRETFEFKARKAANLDALKQQMEDIKQSFGDLLKRLPDKTEVAGLLVDISQQGLGAGLEFELFKPGNEGIEEFYVELPIQIRVTGDYHAFGEFISGVADLPRIVTQHDIHIYKKGTEEKVIMESTAKTYRYLDESEGIVEEEEDQ